MKQKFHLAIHETVFPKLCFMKQKSKYCWFMKRYFRNYVSRNRNPKIIDSWNNVYKIMFRETVTFGVVSWKKCLFHLDLFHETCTSFHETTLFRETRPCFMKQLSPVSWNKPGICETRPLFHETGLCFMKRVFHI